MAVEKHLKNQTFVYIYAIAIIMVIDDHCSTRIGINSTVFPYNSFYMPLFVFCSGYFFKKRTLKNEFIHRARKQLIPYILYDVVMIIITMIIDYLFKTHWYRRVTIKSVIILLLDHPTTDLNGAAWFAIMLFWLSIIYCMIKSLVSDNRTSDCILALLISILGLISLYICINFTPISFAVRWLCRTTFYLQFYHLGHMFKVYFEPMFNRQRRTVVCSVCIAVNVLLLVFFGDSINFYSTHGMGKFHHIVLPLITSITGIIFYYEVMSFASERIGERKGISFIADNTFVIMQVHLLFVNIPNLFIYRAITHGATKYSDFPVKSFVTSTWIRYSPNSRLIGFFCGLVGSLLVAYTLEKLKTHKKRFTSF